MNQEQVLNLSRAVLLIIGTVLMTNSTKTGVTEPIWTAITGAVLTLIPLVWGLIAHTQAHSVGVVAAMSSTDVSNGGRTITIHDTALAQSAKDNATPLSAAA